MSLGGLTTLALTTVAPELVRRVVLVDVLPTLDPRGAVAMPAARVEPVAPLAVSARATLQFQLSLKLDALVNGLTRPGHSWCNALRVRTPAGRSGARTGERDAGHIPASA